jgi:hypothetical protein
MVFSLAVMIGGLSCVLLARAMPLLSARLLIGVVAATVRGVRAFTVQVGEVWDEREASEVQVRVYDHDVDV